MTFTAVGLNQRLGPGYPPSFPILGSLHGRTIAAAKAGVEGLVRSSAITYARQNILINAVAPGLTETPLAAPLVKNDAARAFSLALYPLGRLGRPEDVAASKTFLLGADSGWITGQVLGVDGGLAAGAAKAR